MIGSHPIEGYAIVSADGMIADRDGNMPDGIRNDADQHFLQTAMDQAAVIIHGRHSHEGGRSESGGSSRLGARSVLPSRELHLHGDVFL